MRPERWLPATHELYDPVFANDNKAAFRKWRFSSFPCSTFFVRTLTRYKKDPFSFGTRDCLGKNLAYSELRVAVARLLFRFDYELAPGQEDWHDKSRVIIVWEKGPLKVKLTERKLVSVE